MSPVDAPRLPRHVLAPGSRLYRIHRRDRSPWWFSHDGSGRFDPTSAPDRGACYLAEHELGAWVESFRTVMTLTQDDVDERVLSIATIDRPLRVVDLAARTALAAGVTAALTAGADYRDSQALASAVAMSDDGIRWRARHDLEQQLVVVALFARTGAARDAWLPTETVELPTSLVHEAEEQFGYRVLPTP